MSKPDDEDDPTPAEHGPPPSAVALQQLHELAKHQPGPERAAAAWRVVAGAAGNPDVHAVLDFAREAELVLPCEQTDPAAANLTWTNPLDGSEMVWIPPGKFGYGDKDEPAEAAGFSLGRFPVTNEQFARFLAESRYSPDVDHPENELFVNHFRNGKPAKGQERHPVTHVSLFDTFAYCHWAGGTLPTEWLWEKAARGADGRKYPWGTTPPTQKLAHVGANGTCEVGKFSGVRSPYGCEELIGNVSEWTLPTEAGATLPQPGMPGQACVRGACFFRSTASATKASHRRMLSAARRNQWVGFRLAVLLPVRPATQG